MQHGGVAAASADDWFAPPGAAHGITPATTAATSRQQQQPPTSGNSGFYSMTTNNNNNSSASTGSGAIGSNDNIHGSSGNNYSTNNHYGNSQQQPYGSSNLYVNNSNAAPTAPPAPSYGFTGGGYYGGNSGGYANNSYQQAMTGAIGGGIGGTGGVNNNSSNNVAIPPASAFGSHMNTNSSSSSSLYNDGGTNSYNDMSGTMGGPIGIAPTSLSSMPNVFDPNIAAAKKAEAMQQQQQQQHYIAGGNNPSTISYEEDYDNEPPLLEELGVNFPHIYSKSRAVLFPFGTHAKSLESGLIENDADLAGPLAFALGLGGELLLAGKLHFGFVYGFGLSGCIFMTLILNLLNPNGAVSMWTVVSILGYALLPVNLLACVNIFMRVHKLGVWGMVLAVLVIVWCTTASARLFERGCNMREQRFLVAYPTALLYSAFVIITIF